MKMNQIYFSWLHALDDLTWNYPSLSLINFTPSDKKHPLRQSGFKVVLVKNIILLLLLLLIYLTSVVIYSNARVAC